MQNKISALLSEADRAAVLDAFGVISAKLSFLVDLTPAERQELPKMGDRSLAFVRKSVEMAQGGGGLFAGRVRSGEVQAGSGDL